MFTLRTSAKDKMFFLLRSNHVNFSVPPFRATRTRLLLYNSRIIVVRHTTYPKSHRDDTRSTHPFIQLRFYITFYEITAILGRTTVVRLAAEGPRSRPRRDTSWRMRAHVSRPSNNHVHTPLHYVDVDLSGKRIYGKKKNRERTHSPRKFGAAAAAATRQNDHYHFVTCLQCLKCGLLSGAIVAYREYRV